mmetsp:Transcript_8081/g.18759  ORF Transcript_8081/g.18759 Transcript_8081/m.18759 type:complete len:211 (+) Transcript_8081:36-668(+)
MTLFKNAEELSPSQQGQPGRRMCSRSEAGNMPCLSAWSLRCIRCCRLRSIRVGPLLPLLDSVDAFSRERAILRKALGRLPWRASLTSKGIITANSTCSHAQAFYTLGHLLHSIGGRTSLCVCGATAALTSIRSLCFCPFLLFWERLSIRRCHTAIIDVFLQRCLKILGHFQTTLQIFWSFLTDSLCDLGKHDIPRFQTHLLHAPPAHGWR